MTDARGALQGNWKRNGNRVTIRFADCEYQGTINGKVMRGTAHFFVLQGGRNWQFTVTRV